MGRRIPFWAIALTCSLAISSTTAQNVNNINAQKAERWSRQIDQSGFAGPTVNTRPANGEDWIPINPNNERAGRVLNFGPQQQLFAAQSQQIFQPHPPQFLMQTQFIPPTFPGNDLRQGPIPQQSQQPQFMSVFGDHRFGSLSHVPQQQALHSQKSPLNNPGPSKPKNTPFQFEFHANNNQKSPLFQQLSPQFVNEQFFEIPDKNQMSLKKQPAFESKFNTESFNQKPKKPIQQQIFHHPPPPPSAPSAPSGPAQPQFLQHPGPPPQQQQQQQEEVQLLYVPLETFYQQQQQQQQKPHPQHLQQNSVYNNPLNQFINPNHINEFYTPQPNVRPLTIQTTTPFPRTQLPTHSNKPKAHQPPLAMFMLQDPKYSGGITVNDILNTLRRERSIAVLDAITAEAQPNVFIGPGGLKTPLGYEKFELPYLSAIDMTRSDRKLDAYPFFVAPLSYQAPNGFTKIPLPHPHVGSIVINDHKMIQQYSQPPPPPPQPSTTSRPVEFLSPATRQYNSNFINATPLPQKFDPLTRKYVSQSTTESYRQSYTEEQYLKEEKPTNVPKQSFVYQRPTVSPTGTKVVNEDFFNLKKTKPATTFESSFNQHQQGPSAYDVFQQSVKSHTANHFEPTTTRTTQAPPTTKAVTQIKEFIPQTTPAPYNTFSATPNVVESYQFSTPSSIQSQKNNQYHEEFRSSTAASVDSFQQREPQNNRFEYTPISQEIPSSKPKKVVHQFNFGQNVLPDPTPSAYPTETTRYEPQPTIPSRGANFFNHQAVQQYEQAGPHSSLPANPSISPEPTPSDVTFFNRDSQRQYESVGPHRAQPVTTEEPITNAPPSNLDYYNNNLYQNHQQQYTNDLPFAEIQTTTEQYRLPSELPPINANLPNMINSLMEMEEAQRQAMTAEAEVVTTNAPSTRRPIQRGRRPVQRVTSTTENVDNGEDEVTTTRRPVTHRHRTRPPVTQNQEQVEAKPQRGQHYRTSTIVRNPNRVRFNPSNEERSELKRNRPKSGNREEGNDKNLEYQRDVLNQNYPVINGRQTSPATPATTTTSTTEAVHFEPEVENQNQFQYTEQRPRDNVVTVMAESYPNFDYNPQSTPTTYFSNSQPEEQQQPQFNQGDNLAQKVEEEERLVYNAVRNNVDANEYVKEQEQEVVEVVTKPQEERVVLIGEKQRRHRITTTTTEAPTTTEAQQSTIAGILRNRRPAFVRRPIGRVSTTTTEAPVSATTVASATQDRFTIRSRTRGEAATTQRTVPQIRGRLRQRTTTTPAPEEVVENNEDAPVQRKPVFRAQYRSRTRPKFALETQETQWSVNQNVESFQPIEGNDYITRKYDIIDDLVDNEPEIITADPNAEETFVFTVTPKNQAPLGQTEDKESSPRSTNENTETENEINPRIVAAKDEDIPEDTKVETSTENRSGRRRGIWKRVRVRPADGFETAESQHVSQSAYNVLPDEYNKYESKGAHNSFSKGFYGDFPVNQEIETASALTMEMEPEAITEEIVQQEMDEEVVTNVPEAKIDATEEKEFLFESTTVVPEVEKTVTVQVEEKPLTTTTSQPITEEAPLTPTTESIYDEVRKSLSELFSRGPEEEEVATDLPLTEEKEVEPVTEQEIPKETTTTTVAPEVTVAAEESHDEETASIAHVVELPTEPEVKANVTEINRSYVIATSTSQQVSHETEICYRGRCIKSVDAKKKN